MTIPKRSHHVSPIGKALREHASFHGIKINYAAGLTKDNYYDAVALVNEFAEMTKELPSTITVARDLSRSPDTGLRVSMVWRKHLSGI